MAKTKSELVFPVYRVPETYPIQYSGTRTFIEGYDGEERTIDDTAIPGNTIGLRRLKLSADGVKLFRLRYKFSMWQALVTHKEGGRGLYIDSSGYTFMYRPSQFITINWFEVSCQVDQGNGTLLYLKGHNVPIKHRRMLEPELTWYAGIASLAGDTILFDLCNEPKPRTKRKV